MNNLPPGVSEMDPHFNQPTCPKCMGDLDERDDGHLYCEECDYSPPTAEDEATERADQEFDERMGN